MSVPAPAVVVCPDPEAVAREAATRFLAIAEHAVTSHRRFTVALSGGSTPRRLYSLLAEEPLRSRVPWVGTHLFWGDERCVPPDHPDSNYRSASQTLISHVPVPPEQIHRMPAESAPSQAASDYESELRCLFHLRRGAFPTFDLILLGMGSDAHTASLFPGTTALQENRRLVAANYVEKLGAFRLTLTPPVLNAASHVHVLVVGKEKAPALRQVLEGEYRPEVHPAQLLRPRRGKLVWIVDEAAANQLERPLFTG